MSDTKLCECGCRQPTTISARNNSRFGHVKGQPLRFIQHHQSKIAGLTHGLSKNVCWHAFVNARNRCCNPNHKQWANYGGRGIRFCFDSFEQFIAHIGPRPEGMSLDRINNDGNYEPGNVKWSTQLEQHSNKRPMITNHEHDDIVLRLKVRIAELETLPLYSLCGVEKDGE